MSANSASIPSDPGYARERQGGTWLVTLLSACVLYVFTIFCQAWHVFWLDRRRQSSVVRRLFKCGEREGNGFLTAHRGTAGLEGCALVTWEAFLEEGVESRSRRFLGKFALVAEVAQRGIGVSGELRGASVIAFEREHERQMLQREANLRNVNRIRPVSAEQFTRGRPRLGKSIEGDQIPYEIARAGYVVQFKASRRALNVGQRFLQDDDGSLRLAEGVFFLGKIKTRDDGG